MYHTYIQVGETPMYMKTKQNPIYLPRPDIVQKLGHTKMETIREQERS